MKESQHCTMNWSLNTESMTVQKKIKYFEGNLNYWSHSEWFSWKFSFFLTNILETKTKKVWQYNKPIIIVKEKIEHNRVVDDND